ncbi:F-box/kelch-repeat protein At3g23880-like [Salvia miltiorrhiza]|uniref:F-box/kelch-repeat protein At3g23880-like n=1 Tax=Salvia miltiorrhiza TaxID=226208 RepID=UPI0025ABF5AB|nr:F-box/kelch-repeat protein At3g23880-like [Salvia miltiorrhiza]
MAGFAVVSKDERNKHRLSVMCPVELSVSENLNVNSFKKGDTVLGGSCGGLLYFHGDYGHSFICNLKTNQMKVLTPPNFLPPPNEGSLTYSGLGYDAKSGDLKVIREYVQNYIRKVDDETCGGDGYHGCKFHTELYSSKDDEWKKIKQAVGCLTAGVGVFVEETGSCYWVAIVDPSKRKIKEYLERHSITDRWAPHVLSFDFATESFKLIPLPATATTIRPKFLLCKVGGSIGALAYWKSCSSELCIKAFVVEGTSWGVLCDDIPPLADVERPLGLKDDRWLFVEAKASDSGQLMVYDLSQKQSKKLNIYDYPGRMHGISYDAESTDPPLPRSTPITDYYLSKVRSGEEDES